MLITCDSLLDAKDALINSKIYKTLGVVYLSKIKDWSLMKGESKRSQSVLVGSDIIQNRLILVLLL